MVSQNLKVKVKYFTTLRELAGSPQEELEVAHDATLADLIRKIATKYGKEARTYLYHRDQTDNAEKIDPGIYFLIDGKNARLLDGLNTHLEDGNTVAIIPPIGGG